MSETSFVPIYINDLPLVTKNATPSIFADDTGLMAASESFSHLKNLIEEDIQSLASKQQTYAKCLKD